MILQKKQQDVVKILTETELELMQIVWMLKEASVADVLEHLPAHRALAYTSVSTILRILEKKEVLTVRKEGRGHIYIPLLSREDYEKRAVRHVLDKVFAGKPGALVTQLISEVGLSQLDLQQLKELINRQELKK